MKLFQIRSLTKNQNFDNVESKNNTVINKLNIRCVPIPSFLVSIKKKRE